ncbi:MAG: hypothetical protein HY079_02195 [Elusimicrobia bacterium]|nr:hypothetical protein [Elusimicrobiota bacterium]
MNGSLLLAAALVWVPSESFTHWSKVDELMRERSDIKLTVALTPQMATPLAKAALAPWAAAGRVEIAARLHGDPVLPLVAAHPAAPRPDDALERPADARRTVEKRLAAGPAGFVPGAGALDASLIGPLGSSGARWVLAGPYAAAGSTWAAEGTAVFVPARAAGKGAAPATADLVAPGAVVVDESAEPESRLLAVLKDLRDRPAGGWATVAELAGPVGEGRPAAANIASWPGWDGAAAAVPEDPSARAAYDAYGDAAKALARYQNSGAADLKVLESATTLLRKAQEAVFYRAPAPGAPAGLPHELRARLLAVYKRLKVAAPDSLYAAGASTGPVTAADLPTGVRLLSGPGWIGFDNPVASLAKAPAGMPNADPWRLRGVRVEWNDDRVLFRLFPARVDAVPAPPRPVYDVYIDLNHVVGAGSLRLFDGRGAFAQARDAWEFALTVGGGDARLYRAGVGDPDEVAAMKAEYDPAKVEVRVAVPREVLRGNPARWGYIVLALAEDPARPDRFPPSALIGADGTQTLGLIGPLEQQKAVLDHPGSTHRVAAVRQDAGPAR